MDACRYCREYHIPEMVCDAMIEAIRNGTYDPGDKDKASGLNERDGD